MRKILLGCLYLVLACAGSAALAAPAETLVSSPKAYQDAMKKARPGDMIILANGNWVDFEMVVQGKGTPDNPITVTAQEPGKVVLSGRSNLRIGGSHLVVRGLVFRNGYSPTGEVISFRRTKDDLATNSRVTDTVIDGYSNPDRFESDYWVALYGRNNRFDHNHLQGKTNTGVTLAVRLDSEGSRQNHHRIDHNYFGPRPVLGSNGGETLRVGTSAYSMFDSLTTIESNYFEQCSGEVEIISIKSGRNLIRGNVFRESQGTLTLRHGDGNRVEDNVFFGNGVVSTGGIRVINKDQVVRNNYLEGLRGIGFASALTVMNGVPNSPVNRYVQVDNATIEHNTVVDSRRITLAGGADSERSAPPVNSRFSKNLVLGSDDTAMIEVDDDVSGIAFSGNVLAGKPTTPALPGFNVGATPTTRAANGLLYPTDPAIDAGVSRSLAPIARDATGVAWYPKPLQGEQTAIHATHDVKPGADTLTEAVSQAAAGDLLRLAPGNYSVSKILGISGELTLIGPDPQGAAARSGAVVTITFARGALFELQQRANLHVANLDISGADAPDDVGNTVFRTARTPLPADIRLELKRVNVSGLDVNQAFNVITMGKGAMAQRITISDSSFSDITGAVLSADVETDDYGRYNADDVVIERSKFLRIGGPVVSLYRGGTDESTFGPHFHMTASRLEDVGRNGKNASRSSVALHGVQDVQVEGNEFHQSAGLRVRNTVGEPKVRIVDNRFDETAAPVVEEVRFKGTPRAVLSGNQTTGAAK